jgi:D-aminopeptidase
MQPLQAIMMLRQSWFRVMRLPAAARRFFGSEIVTVATKRGLSREAAELYPFELTRKALYEGAKKAMSQISKCKPFKPQLPLQAKMQWIDADKKVQTKEGVVTDVRRITNF